MSKVKITNSQVNPCDIEKGEPIVYSEFEGRVKYVQGKILTVIEASIADKQQCKAVKDIVKHIFSEELTKMFNWCHPHCQMLTESDMVDSTGDIEPFIKENQPTK